MLSSLALGCATVAGVDEDYYLTSEGSAGSGASSGVAGLTLPAGLLAYHSFTGYSDYDSELYVVQLPSGEHVLQVTSTYDLCTPISGTFSPNGRYLAFSAIVPAVDCTSLDRQWFEILVVDLDEPSAPLIRITDNQRPDEDPHFGPDGQTLYFKHDGHLASVPFPLPATAFNDCGDNGGGFCFTLEGGEQSKPVVAPEDDLLCYHEGSGTTADVFCFPLSQQDQRIEVAVAPNLGESRPAIFGEFLYYIRHSSASNLNHLIVRQPLAGLGGTSIETAGFNRSGLYDYTDPAGLSGELIVYSTDDTAARDHDLFVAEFGSDTGVNIDELLGGSNTINGSRNELGASFHPTP